MEIEKKSNNLSNVSLYIKIEDPKNVIFNDIVSILMEVCKHDPYQATQCVLLAKYKGECEILKGTYQNVEKVKEILLKKGLKVFIRKLTTV